MPALHIAGGVLLFVIAVEMIFPGLGPMHAVRDRPTGEPFIVPLATPLIAGPSASATIMILISRDPGRLWWWLAALVVALGVTVYLSWVFGNQAPLTDTTGATNLSDVIDVGNTNIEGVEGILTENAEKYFTTARLSRQKTRDEAIQTMQDTINNATDEEVKMTVAQSVLVMADNIEAEGRIENLVMAKGFADCMAYINEETVSVVVATGEDGLTAAQAAQIQDIAVTESGADVENIRIIEMK
jgi:stage III sporulation protein AH